MCFGTSCSAAHRVATKLADEWITLVYEGVDAQMNLTSLNLKKMPQWICLLAALKPVVLIKGYKVNWPDVTKPLSFSLESEGSWFIKFTIIASKALNGTPTIGLVDAEASSNMMQSFQWPPSKNRSQNEWPLDLSRSQYRSQFKAAGHGLAWPPADKEHCFAMSFSPGCSSVHASLVEGQSQELVEPPRSFLHGTRQDEKPHAWKAMLNWPSLGDETRKWNAPIQAGFYVKDGSLSLWRKVGTGWHSSGVICRGLPERVLPCVFMSSFTGYASVKFNGLSYGPPPCCQQCDAAGHGIAAGWWPWPLQD